MSTAVILGCRRSAVPSGKAIDNTTIDQHMSAQFFPTPPEATRALLSVECFAGPVWEPACGKGHIARVLVAAGHDVIASDLNAWGYGITGVDFLDARSCRVLWPAGLLPAGLSIVTNPPYGKGLADRFVRRALDIVARTGGKVAMLLNLASLSHECRTAFWQTLPPARVWIVDGIVCWPDPDRPPQRHFLQHRYCWCVWDRCDADQPTRLGWLAGAQFRQPDSTTP